MPQVLVPRLNCAQCFCQPGNLESYQEMPAGWLDQTADPHSRAISGPKLLFEILLPHSFQMGVAHYR